MVIVILYTHHYIFGYNYTQLLVIVIFVSSEYTLLSHQISILLIIPAPPLLSHDGVVPILRKPAGKVASCYLRPK